MTIISRRRNERADKCPWCGRIVPLDYVKSNGRWFECARCQVVWWYGEDDDLFVAPRKVVEGLNLAEGDIG